MIQLLLCLLRLDDVLDNLGLLNKEGADDTGANAVSAARATVGALDSLVALRDSGVLAGAESLHTRELGVAVTALGRAGELADVQVVQLTAGGLDDPTAVGPGVVGVALTQSETLSHLVSLLLNGGSSATRTLQSVVRVVRVLTQKQWNILSHDKYSCLVSRVHSLRRT